MTRAALLLRKDLRVLARSRGVLALLVAYPLATALLVALVANYASARPRVALVDEEGLPTTVRIGDRRFDVEGTIRRVGENVVLVRLTKEEAEHELRNGGVVATITVPPGFIGELQRMVRSPRLELETARGALSARVTQQVQALVYALNRELQDAFIEANLEYVDLLLHGGEGSFLGREFDLLGLDGAERVLTRLPPGPEVERMQDFVRDAKLALGATDDALRSTANPIELVRVGEGGTTWLLSAEIQALAIALTITFLALMLAAGALAAERDENVLGRLARGPVRLTEVVISKVALAAVVATVLGVVIALVFGSAIEAANVEGGEPWQRVPLVAVGLVLAGASLGAVGALIGALARETRTASLAAVLVVLPIVFVGLVPRDLVPAAAVVSDAFPFAHARRFFGSALYELDPWGALAREALWLVALAVVFVGATRVAMRRLLA